MELYSGQGRVLLAKKNPDGTLQKRFFVGNAPFFSVNFLTGDIQLVIDELKDETLEIICGSGKQEESVIVPADEHGINPDLEYAASRFEIGDAAPSVYQLTFDGVNTASTTPNGLAFPKWKLTLFHVTFTPAEGWDFISQEIISIKVSGMAHKDEAHNGKRGAIYRLHSESVTGLRTTDLRQVVAEV